MQYNRFIPRKLKQQVRFIIGEHINNISNSADTVLMAESERKLRHILKLKKKSKKKGLTVNCE